VTSEALVLAFVDTLQRCGRHDDALQAVLRPSAASPE
jgi:hypothetical protein